MRRIEKLSVAMIKDEEVEQLASLMTRTMQLAVTVQDGVVWLSDNQKTVQVQLHWLLRRD